MCGTPAFICEKDSNSDSRFLEGDTTVRGATLFFTKLLAACPPGTKCKKGTEGIRTFRFPGNKICVVSLRALGPVARLTWNHWGAPPEWDECSKVGDRLEVTVADPAEASEIIAWILARATGDETSFPVPEYAHARLGGPGSAYRWTMAAHVAYPASQGGTL